MSIRRVIPTLATAWPTGWQARRTPAGLRDHVHLRDRSDAAAPPCPNVLELRSDFVLQVPGKNQHVIRTGRADPFRRLDRDMGAGQKRAVVDGMPVHGKV